LPVVATISPTGFGGRLLGEVTGCGVSERSVGTDDTASGRIRRGRSRLTGGFRRRANGEDRAGVLSGTFSSGVWSIKVIALSTADSLGCVGRRGGLRVFAVSRRLTLVGDGVSFMVAGLVDWTEPVFNFR
jgi:hypothetical protein